MANLRKLQKVDSSNIVRCMATSMVPWQHAFDWASLGTNQKFVDGVMREGKICLLEIDIQGCEKVYASQLECNYIFIDPPSFEALKARLAQRYITLPSRTFSNRGTETPEQVARRLTTAENELKRVKDLSYFTHILNDDLDTCYKMVVEQLNTWYPSLKLSVPKS